MEFIYLTGKRTQPISEQRRRKNIERQIALKKKIIYFMQLLEYFKLIINKRRNSVVINIVTTYIYMYRD